MSVVLSGGCIAGIQAHLLCGGTSTARGGFQSVSLTSLKPKSVKSTSIACPASGLQALLRARLSSVPSDGCWHYRAAMVVRPQAGRKRRPSACAQTCPQSKDPDDRGVTSDRADRNAVRRALTCPLSRRAQVRLMLRRRRQMLAPLLRLIVIPSFLGATEIQGWDLPIDQAPEPMFSTVVLLQPLDELGVRGEITVIRDCGIARVTFGQMARGVAIALGFAAGQCLQHHGAAHQRGGERMLRFERVCRRRESVIGIPIQLPGPRKYDPCRALVRWPIHEEADRRTQMRVVLGKVQGGRFGFDVVEIG